MVQAIINRVILTSPTFLVRIFSAIEKKIKNPIGTTAMLIFRFKVGGQ